MVTLRREWSWGTRRISLKPRSSSLVVVGCVFICEKLSYIKIETKEKNLPELETRLTRLEPFFASSSGGGVVLT